MLWEMMYYDPSWFNYEILITKCFYICAPLYVRHATANMAPLPQWPDVSYAWLSHPCAFHLAAIEGWKVNEKTPRRELLPNNYQVWYANFTEYCGKAPAR